MEMERAESLCVTAFECPRSGCQESQEALVAVRRRLVRPNCEGQRRALRDQERRTQIHNRETEEPELPCGDRSNGELGSVEEDMNQCAFHSTQIRLSSHAV